MNSMTVSRTISDLNKNRNPAACQIVGVHSPKHSHRLMTMKTLKMNPTMGRCG